MRFALPATAPRLALAAGACSVLALAWSLGPGQLDGIEVIGTPVAGTVHMLEGQGGNIGICAGPDGVLMIDDQFEPLAPKIRAAFERISSAPLRYVLNTHHHGDHTGGNPIFGAEAAIVAHVNVRKRLEAEGAAEAMLEHGLPVLTYEDGMHLYLNGEHLRLVHFPAGHTDGDTVVFFEHANAVHMGDLFFAGKFPYIDLDGGGSVGGVIHAVAETLKSIDDETRIIPGHGPLSTQADLAAYLDMLRDTQARVASVTAEGATVEDMLRDDLFSDYAGWGTGYVNLQTWLQTLVRDLAAGE